MSRLKSDGLARSRWQLWTAFLLVHAAVVALGLLQATNPAGDVYRVYEPWSAAFLHGGYAISGVAPYDMVHYGFVGITSDWVYPPLAIIPMLAAWLFAWPLGYTAGWGLLVTAVDAAAFAILLGNGRSRGRRIAAWFWLGTILLLGPVGLFRIEGVTVPLTIIGCLLLRGRLGSGSALLAIASWMKVWPIALLGAALVSLRRRWLLIAVAGGISVATVATVAILGNSAAALSFVSGQTSRGIQIESPVATVYLWRAVFDAPNSSIFYNSYIEAYEITGPGISAAIAIMTPLLAATVAGLLLIGVWRLRRGDSFMALFPTLAVALVGALIVVNKVGSPQYIAWLIAPVVYAVVVDRHRWKVPAMLTLVICALTQWGYPNAYDGLLVASWGPVLILTLRNLLMIMLLIWTTCMLISGRGHYSSRASSLGSSKSREASSSTLTSLNVSTRTDFTKRSARYTSHTQTSFMDSSK